MGTKEGRGREGEGKREGKGEGRGLEERGSRTPQIFNWIDAFG